MESLDYKNVVIKVYANLNSLLSFSTGSTI